ncbi:MAG: hypothetical protein V3R81_01735, partial [Gammaproteobacteria bacterium]
PENTGMALDALAGRVAEESVERSLAYLESQSQSLSTPLSLGWCLMGLGAWGKRPDDYRERVLNSLLLQKTYGDFATPLLCLLIVSYVSNGGLAGVFRNGKPTS